MDKHGFKRKQRIRRHRRVRRKVHGSSERPRLAVFRSNRHIYCQVIDDEAGRTVVSASTMEKDFVGGEASYGGNRGAAEAIGKSIAERAQAAGIKKVSFDRGGFCYHGRVKALADAAREAGLEF